MTCDCQLPSLPQIYVLGHGDEFACCADCHEQIEPGPCRVCGDPGMHWTYCLRCAVGCFGEVGDA